jgi:hypothetical protein
MDSRTGHAKLVSGRAYRPPAVYKTLTMAEAHDATEGLRGAILCVGWLCWLASGIGMLDAGQWKYHPRPRPRDIGDHITIQSCEP